MQGVVGTELGVLCGGVKVTTKMNHEGGGGRTRTSNMGRLLQAAW